MECQWRSTERCESVGPRSEDARLPPRVFARLYRRTEAPCTHAESSATNSKVPTWTREVGKPPVPIRSARQSAPARNGHPLHVVPASQSEIRFEVRPSPQSVGCGKSEVGKC